MVTLTIITLVLVVLTICAVLVMAIGLSAKAEKLEHELLVNKQLYDSLEEQVSKQYANMATMNNSLDQYKTLLGGLVKDAETWKASQEAEAKKKPSKKKQ